MEQRKMTAVILAIIVMVCAVYLVYCARLFFVKPCVPCAAPEIPQASKDAGESPANYALTGGGDSAYQDMDGALHSDPVRSANQIAAMERNAERVERRAQTVREALNDEKAQQAESAASVEEQKASQARTIVTQSPARPVVQPTREQKARMRASGIEIR